MSYSRVKFFWGALDVVHSDESPYTAAQTKAMGADALPPGIGVRRAQLVFTRTTLAPPQDAMTTHIDFLNMTNGSPDDTWTDADFLSLETKLITFIDNLKALMHASTHFEQIRWYRVGPGINPPNPAIRIQSANVLGVATGAVPPQVAASVTLKTVPRRQWGRMYLPLTALPALSTQGRFASSQVTAVGGRVNDLISSAAAEDFLAVIFSKVRGKAYTVEQVQVDDVPDVIRSRRFNEATFKYISP